jgi:hypothetical protein
MPLEGLWWADDMSQFSVEDKSNWKWTLMIMQPGLVTQALVSVAYEQVKENNNPVALPRVLFDAFAEGKTAQKMQICQFSDEGPTIDHIHQYIRQK